MNEIILFLNDTTSDQFWQWLGDYTQFSKSISFDDEQGRGSLHIQHAKLMRLPGGGLPFAEMEAILMRETGPVAQAFPAVTCFRFEWLAVGRRLKVKINRPGYYELAAGYFQELLSEIATNWPETSSAIREYRNSSSEQSPNVQISTSLELPADRVERIYPRGRQKFADILTNFVQAWFGVDGNRQTQFIGVMLKRDGIFWSIQDVQGLDLITLITKTNDDDDREVYVQMWPMQWESTERADVIRSAFDAMVKYLDNHIKSANRAQSAVDNQHSETNITQQSGGVEVNANQVNVGNDVVGRDKIESASGHIIHAEPGATVIVNPLPVASADEQNHQQQAKVEPASSTQAEQRRSSLTEPAEMLFDCGHRVWGVREEIKLTASQFAEAIHYTSVKTFGQMEQRQHECPESVLQRVSDLSGVSLEWLKHGTGKKYPPAEFAFFPLKPAIEIIEGLTPLSLYFVIELKSYEMLVLAQKGEYNWRVFDLGLNLDFWNWVDEFWYIPRIYAFFDVAQRKFGDIAKSRILPQSVVGKLRKGNEHPLKLLRSAKVNLAGLRWADDITDIYHRYPAADEYGSRYGKWFLRVQDEFRHYLELYQKHGSSS